MLEFFVQCTKNVLHRHIWSFKIFRLYFVENWLNNLKKSFSQKLIFIVLIQGIGALGD